MRYRARAFRFEEKDPLATGMERDGEPRWLLSFPSFFKRVRIADLFHLLFKMNARAVLRNPVAFYFYLPFFLFFFCSVLPRLLSSVFFSFPVFLFCLAQIPLSIGRNFLSSRPQRMAGCGFSSARRGEERERDCLKNATGNDA